MKDHRKASGERLAAGKLSPDVLSCKCSPDIFGFENTSQISPLKGKGIIGQERAVKAMDFGLQVDQPGYNLFLTGPVGTGKTSYAESKVREIAAGEETPGDICYVNNFKQPDSPISLQFAAGEAAVFKRDMEELVQDLKREIKKTFEGEEYEARQAQITKKYEAELNDLWYHMENYAASQGFSVQKTATGIYTMPTDEEGKPLPKEEFLKLPQEQQKKINQVAQDVQAEINDTLRKIRAVEKLIRSDLKKLERETGLYAAGYLINQLKDEYGQYPEVGYYLDDVLEDVIENIDDFRLDEEETPPSQDPYRRVEPREKFNKYKVNIFVDNGKTEGAPVIVENNPTYYNLFGRVEYKSNFGNLVTDFTLIKPGSIHLANGGYIILQALDLFLYPTVWQALKRTLKWRQSRIENLGEQASAISISTLKPEPIDIDVKIVLVGSAYLYHQLYALDEDFKKLFKVKVDFDYVMDRDDTKLKDYAAFVCRFCSEKKMRHLDKWAMARVVEYSSRLASDQEKLSTRFHSIAELLVEANYWAEHEGHGYITEDDLLKAMEEKVFRSNLLEEKIQEDIKRGTTIVSTEGWAVGQINGLSILQIGDYAFGKPNRITARTSLGQRGIINIEREVKMSGPTHSKGVLILGGFLSGRYAKDKPLSLTASLTFEQLYGEVDGDSASSAELYALLSELSGVPINQGLAVTGSVNQYGEIQPIGGVNQKIEGFFYSCKSRGLTGSQGVIIPSLNIRNLVLKDEVIKAVEDGRFHIWAVSGIDEGIEILTGIEAGEKGEDGTYPEGTINYLVDERLRAMAEELRSFGREDHRGEKEAAVAQESVSE